MTDEYLASKGWKLVATRRASQPGGGFVKYWTHPEHSKEDGRFWTKWEATRVQMHVEKPRAHSHPDRGNS